MSRRFSRTTAALSDKQMDPRATDGTRAHSRASAVLNEATPSATQRPCLIVGGVSDQHDGNAAYVRRITQLVADHDLAGRVQILGYQPNVAEFV